MPEFKISASLEGHGDDVRAVVFPHPNAVFSASRDATVRLWKLVSTPPPTYDYNITCHGSAFINALAYYPPTLDFPDGLVLSGGQDTIIEARQPGKAADDNADAMLLGHAHNVCALDVSHEGGWVVSGSWDSTARLWKIGKWECDLVLDGHQGSVWTVLAYDKDTIITGCADKMIRIFNTSGKLLKTIKDSQDVVRALCKVPASHPSGAHFASASNDGLIRLYTIQGQLVGELHGHESFIYSLAALPSGELVSAGEDRTVRVWDGMQCVQTITHPAISVWSVAACQETGDIITGASDRVTRIFTRSEDRVASAEVIQQFERTVKESAIPEQQVGKINKEQLPGPEFLKQKSGTKDGQVQMIRETDGSITAHTWSMASREWIAVGTVVDSAASSGRKIEYLGQDYDYVFDVDVEDGKPPLKLPYNVSQNPYEAATKFIQDNELSMNYLDQVAQFIVQNSQGASLGQSTQGPTPSGADPWGQERRYRPGDGQESQPAQPAPAPEPRPKVLPQKQYLSIKSANLKVIAKKLQELNEQLVTSGSKELSLSPSELETVVSLCTQLESSSLNDSPIAGTGVVLLYKVATLWPASSRLPGLDLLRLLAAATPVVATADYDGKDLISGLLSSGVFNSPLNVNNAMLSVRMLANLFETEAGRNLAMSRFDETLPAIKSALSNSGTTPNRNLTIAVATLYINVAVYLTSGGNESAPESSERGLVLLAELTQMLQGEKDSEAVYRSLVAVGTLVKALGEEVKAAAKEVYDVNALLNTISSSSLGKEPRTKGIISEIKEALS
ncbi:WD repeat PLAP family protein [Aspergillus saccharolyticus JOP 1030-1]|uniref:Polyubiquitin binding protein n=1 Tax=Aspergillus saccharolyticus JOP 1030-1 TaxID=1450539 RepID=A0A318ZNL9_9EURO|nr:polyubiquitin binding protein [Aspergillus saccharolyticus JOP 1030-1]PYH41688.1 polyubiquitin binding protein [Aspergillus saccharolyticus JOP 1030-1]